MINKQPQTIYFPNTTIQIYPGDVLYSSLGRSTYFVGHSVIIGENYIVKEVIPRKPGLHMLTLQQFLNRHHKNDTITLLRSPYGAQQAAQWITRNIQNFKQYNLLNYNIHTLEKSYCYKFIVQAYLHGAHIQLVKNPHRLLLPNDIKKSPVLKRVAVIQIK